MTGSKLEFSMRSNVHKQEMTNLPL